MAVKKAAVPLTAPRKRTSARADVFRPGRKYPAQVVIPETREVKTYIETEAKTDDVHQADVGRELLAAGRRVREHAKLTGYSVDQLLQQLEKVPPRTR